MHVILNISDSDKHFSSAIEEYQKRLWKDVVFDTLKPFKDDNHQLVIQKETESVIKTSLANQCGIVIAPNEISFKSENLLFNPSLFNP